MQAHVDFVIKLISRLVSSLVQQPALSHEAGVLAVVQDMLLAVLQAEGILGCFQNMLLELTQHIWLLPYSRPLVV